MTVDAGGCQRQVQDVGCELRLGPCVNGAQTTVMGLGAGDDVFDVGLPDGLEPIPRVGAVDAAQFLDYLGFYRLGR